MRTTNILVFALAAISSVPLMAQQPGTSPQEPNPEAPVPQQTSPSAAPEQAVPRTAPQPGDSAAVPVPSTANAPEVSNPQLRPVTGELQSKLDTKDAKTGDSVVVKTTQQATTARGTVIPKGSKLVGHVTDVEAKGKSGENSRLTIQFDQAELKGGNNMPINSVLQSIGPVAGPVGAGTNSGSPTANASGAGSEASQPTNSTSSVPSSSMPPSGDTASQNPSGPAVGTVIARNGNVAIRTTAIPGVLLANNVDGQPFANAAGALLGAKMDVHLDSGTPVVVAIADAGTKSGR